jgi:hypothetical protein
MHTKLPWSAKNSNGMWLQDHDWSADNDFGSSTCAPIHSDGTVVAMVVVASIDDDGDAELDANAAIIVRAVNNHDDLVAALEKCQVVLAGESLNKSSLIEALTACKEVLAKVKS